ncbi:hypothetical protein K8I61_15975 [bacterium]|nr:hypothetical protein [bacterium]
MGATRSRNLARWLAAVFFVAVAASLWITASSGAHLASLASRGRGVDRLSAVDGRVAGAGLHARSVFLDEDGARREWRLDVPIHEVAPAAPGQVLAVPYMDRRVLVLGGAGAISEAVFKTRMGSRSAVVAGLAGGPGEWFVALYDRYHDDTRRRKAFPFIMPEQLFFRFEVVRLSDIRAGRNNAMRPLFADHGEWHEESFHPWRLAKAPGGDALLILNTMSEELLAIGLAGGEPRFRVPVPPGPVDLAVDERFAYVASPASDRIAVFDADTGETRTPIGAARGVVSLASTGRGVVAASRYTRRVIAARPIGDGWEIRERPWPGVPAAVAVTNGRVFVADGVTGRVEPFDDRTW